MERTERALMERTASGPLMQRIRMVRDLVIETSKLGELVGFEFLQNRLGCTEYELETAIEKAMQLYPEIREVRIFNRFRHYYHASMDGEQLAKAMRRRENYLRVVYWRKNRVGHNWEACVEWLIDKFTTGAHFMTQYHRNKGNRRDWEGRKICALILKHSKERGVDTNC